MSHLSPDAVKRIARDCREHSEKYRCSLHDSIAEWEGYAGNGLSGQLHPAEKAEVAAELKEQGFDLDAGW